MKKLLKILPVALIMCVVFTSVFAVSVPIMNDYPEDTLSTIGVVKPLEMVIATVSSYMIVAIIVAVIGIIANWKIFSKAGKPGWASIVPIYNTVVQFQIVGLNPWLILLFIVPFVNFIAIPVLGIMIPFRMAKSYGKDIGWGFGLLFLPFIFNLILAFGSSEYVGPNGQA